MIAGMYISVSPCPNSFPVRLPLSLLVRSFFLLLFVAFCRPFIVLSEHSFFVFHAVFDDDRSFLGNGRPTPTHIRSPQF